MNRVLLALILCAVPPFAAAADDYKISQLEQAVRTLQRQVDEQSRQLDELRRRLSAAPNLPAVPAVRGAPVLTSDTWIDAQRWQQLRIGMTELEVVSLLGPPTSMRAAEGGRVLLYAREIGSSGFLGGSVTLRDRVVAGIEKPVLK